MNDYKLISECKKNNPKYQRMLLDKYSDALMKSGMYYATDKSLVLDALQETWIIIFNQMHKYNEQGFFLAWARKILIREVLREKKAQNKKVVFIDALKNDKWTQNPAIEKRMELDEVMSLVQKIPSPAQEIFKMNVIDGLKHKEIAEIMEIKESTSRVHVTNARKFLREKLAMISNRKIKV